MPDYSDIIERLEKAPAPDREVDGLIAISRGWTFQKMKGDAKSYWRKPGVTDYYMRSDLPNFTGSIDAALTLVPEGYRWTIGITDGAFEFYATVRHPNEGSNPSLKWMAHGTVNPAVTLLIAILKARAALAGEGGE